MKAASDDETAGTNGRAARQTALSALEDSAAWDLVIIGGGATGLGCAVDAASRGYRTLLLEQHDFAQCTSSRSTKLVHGGVRYLQQGNVRLVREALRERGRLARNAPHLVRTLPFVVPASSRWSQWYLGAGLKIYDLLSGRLSLGRSRFLSRRHVLQRLPTLRDDGLKGGVLYYDGQFDDARLAVALARTAADQGALLLNHVRVSGLIKEHGRTVGVVARDMASGRDWRIAARVVISAVGIFADEIGRWDEPIAPPRIAFSQGAHLVLDRSFLPGDSALLVPRTRDGRVLFAIPWYQRVLVGTTDTPIAQAQVEPQPLEGELQFLLEHVAEYFTRTPTRSDVRSVFAGIRPLVSQRGAPRTAALSRDHDIDVSASGLLTITGGKWTTYRQMAEEAIDKAASIGDLPQVACRTRDLRLHGVPARAADARSSDVLDVYGSDGPQIIRLAQEQPEWNELIHPRLPYRLAEVVWAVRHEWASAVEDVLARRTRALILDAAASIAAAPRVAALMAAELKQDAAWIENQIADYRQLAAKYLMPQ
jgi:glycerol-3-phosphate dehydrogenase